MTPDEADKKQEWAEMDGAIAFHLIERHADDWAETGEMMRAWLRANTPAWHDAPTCEGLWIKSSADTIKHIDQHDIDHLMKMSTHGWRWYGPIPEDKP